VNPGGLIHIVAVWYWFDGQKVYVTTFSGARKARNVQANPKVSLMVDARVRRPSLGKANCTCHLGEVAQAGNHAAQLPKILFPAYNAAHG
jgi:hypothetical protein